MGTVLYRPLCSVLDSYCTVVEGGDGVRYPPPPLSGGPKLNNLTGGVEKKKTQAMDWEGGGAHGVLLLYALG